MSVVQQAIEVGAPLHAVYEQISALANYPRFMTGVRQVTPVGADRTHWVMDLDGQRREFDARITERSLDERVSWSTTDGPLLAETITLRPMGETRTQVVAQLEADAAFLTPGDRHGEQTLNRRLSDDLATFKSLVEAGAMTTSRQMTGRSRMSPASVAARVRRRTTASPQAASEGPLSGGGAGLGTRSGSAPMGGRTPAKDLWGDGMINEADRGGAHDY